MWRCFGCRQFVAFRDSIRFFLGSPEREKKISGKGKGVSLSRDATSSRPIDNEKAGCTASGLAGNRLPQRETPSVSRDQTIDGPAPANGATVHRRDPS